MASANATKEKSIDLEKLDLDDLECQLEEDFGEDLDRELAERLAELDFVDEQKAQIANPDMLGQVVLNTVWDQFTNQVAIQAGEDFVKSNNGLRLDLSDDAHIQTTENFADGKIASHNTEIDYQYFPSFSRPKSQSNKHHQNLLTNTFSNKASICHTILLLYETLSLSSIIL